MYFDYAITLGIIYITLYKIMTYKKYIHNITLLLLFILILLHFIYLFPLFLFRNDEVQYFLNRKNYTRQNPQVKLMHEHTTALSAKFK